MATERPIVEDAVRQHRRELQDWIRSAKRDGVVGDTSLPDEVAILASDALGREVSPAACILAWDAVAYLDSLPRRT